MISNAWHTTRVAEKICESTKQMIMIQIISKSHTTKSYNKCPKIYNIIIWKIKLHLRSMIPSYNIKSYYTLT